jgi:hypothetical protein
MIYANLQKLHDDDRLRLQRLLPFNQSEDFILLTCCKSKLASCNDNNRFEEILVEHRDVFHAARTSEQLRQRFELFKKLKLLRDQEQELVTLIVDEPSDEALDMNLFKCSSSHLDDDDHQPIDSVIDQEIELNEQVEQG